MVQSPSWEANWFAATQEIPRNSRNPKVHYRTHKRPPPVSILGQPNPDHIHKSHLLEIHPNIIHPSTPRSPKWSPSLRFPLQDPIYKLSPPIRATCPAHLILDFITRTILFEQFSIKFVCVRRRIRGFCQLYYAENQKARRLLHWIWIACFLYCKSFGRNCLPFDEYWVRYPRDGRRISCRSRYKGPLFCPIVTNT